MKNFRHSIAAVRAVLATAGLVAIAEIGRASCRERVL